VVGEWGWEDILGATRYFSPDFKLGDGTFGIVYRGRLEGRDVAVKVIDQD